MALYDDFPYTNFHSLNLDWIIKKLSELENGESTTEESSSTATLARNLSGNYPYTNFHSLNLDWIIRSMVELESDFENVTDRMSEIESEWQNLSTAGLLNDQIKNAILNCFQKVAWIDEDGQTYYDSLYDALYPPVVVLTLNAVLDASGHTFYVGDSIEDLRAYLTVTAELSTGHTVTVNDYTLSGSLSIAGENVITVTYSNKSTTVTVTAVAAVLEYISAEYIQSGTVYDTDTLDSLKNGLTVTATYDNGNIVTLGDSDYTLSGTLTEGTSTITVTYQGKTDTFDVTVTHADSSMYNWDFTQSLTDSKQGVTITLPESGATQSSSGLAITNLSAPIQCATIDIRTTPQFTIEWDVTTFAWPGGTGNECLGYVARAASQLQGVMYRGSVPSWSLRDTGGTYYDFSAFSDATIFNGKTCKLQIDYSISNTWKLYCDDTLMASQTVATYNSTLIIGFRGKGTFTGLRIYEGLV